MEANRIRLHIGFDEFMKPSMFIERHLVYTLFECVFIPFLDPTDFSENENSETKILEFENVESAK